MDAALKAKLCCSLRWLMGMLTDGSSYSRDTLQSLSSPYRRTELNHQVISILTKSDLYLAVFGIICPEEDLPKVEVNGRGFMYLIYILSKHGVYVMKDAEGRVVNRYALSQREPFLETAHLAVIDGLMMLHTKTVVSMEGAVNAVSIDTGELVYFKELPDGDYEGLIHWLNRTSKEVIQAETTKRVRAAQVSSYAKKGNSSQLQLMEVEESSIRYVDNIYEDVGEGQCLGALLIHYVPKSFLWADFHFSKQRLSKQQAEENLSKVIEFSNSCLPPPGFHIDKETLVDLKVVHLYKANILSLLAHFFENLKNANRTLTPQVQPLKPSRRFFPDLVAEWQSASDRTQDHADNLTQQSQMTDYPTSIQSSPSSQVSSEGNLASSEGSPSGSESSLAGLLVNRPHPITRSVIQSNARA